MILVNEEEDNIKKKEMKKKQNERLFITNKRGFDVVFDTLGASIYSINVDDICMTLSPKDEEVFAKENLYYGKTIGPIPNRVKDGIIIINNKTYQLDKNEGNNLLHSSKNGIHNQVFDYQANEGGECIEVHFSYKKKDMEDGLPGNIRYDVHYYVDKKENKLSILFEAKSDQDTILGMTNHAYFNLGEDSIDNLKLTIPSHSFVETRKEDLIPLRIREILPCLDFNNAKYINKDINDIYLQNHRSLGYDHCYLLDEGKMRLESDKYQLDITTDFKALQIYSDNYEDGVEMTNTNKKNHRGVAIEPQDEILNRKVLEKDKVYRRRINYCFIKK